MSTLPGCFDVRNVDPGDGRFMIDDFEDGDTLPSSTLFERWRCYTYNPEVGQDPTHTVNCAREQQPGNQSGYGLMAAFMLHDPPNGRQDFGGVGLATFSEGVVDFRGYGRLGFDIRVDFGDLPSTAVVSVSLGCNTVIAERARQQGDYFDLVQTLSVTDRWSSVSVLLSNFTQASWQSNHFTDGPRACLEVINSVRFEVSGQIEDGQFGNGAIHIDDVFLD